MGAVDSDDVVLGFLTPPNAGQGGVPLQTLFGFERVFVKAGESMTVNLFPELTQFTRVEADGSRVAAPGAAVWVPAGAGRRPGTACPGSRWPC